MRCDESRHASTWRTQGARMAQALRPFWQHHQFTVLQAWQSVTAWSLQGICDRLDQTGVQVPAVQCMPLVLPISRAWCLIQYMLSLCFVYILYMHSRSFTYIAHEKRPLWKESGFPTIIFLAAMSVFRGVHSMHSLHVHIVWWQHWQCLVIKWMVTNAQPPVHYCSREGPSCPKNRCLHRETTQTYGTHAGGRYPRLTWAAWRSFGWQICTSAQSESKEQLI